MWRPAHRVPAPPLPRRPATPTPPARGSRPPPPPVRLPPSWCSTTLRAAPLAPPTDRDSVTPPVHGADCPLSRAWRRRGRPRSPWPWTSGSWPRARRTMSTPRRSLSAAGAPRRWPAPCTPREIRSTARAGRSYSGESTATGPRTSPPTSPVTPRSEPSTPGANFVRVPLSESLWVNTCSRSHPSNDTSYPSKVDSEVNSITSRHMVALLDLHESVMSQCGSQGLQPMADAKFAPSFWGAVASRYAKNPLVAFDLYNEPHDISD